MILTATRGQAFKEPFTFKNDKGQLLSAPAGDYRLYLEHGDFSIEYSNLTKLRSEVVWSLSAGETTALPYSTLYFRLTYNGEELTRGVLRVN